MKNTRLIHVTPVVLLYMALCNAPLAFTQSWLCADRYGDVTQVRVTARSGLTLRAAPDRQAAKLAAIPFQEIIGSCGPLTDRLDTVEGKSDYWHQVSFQDQTGYVFGGFIEVVENPPFQMIIPDAGVDSGWDYLDFDTTCTWYALMQADSMNYADFSNLETNQYRLKKLVLKKLPERGNDQVFHYQPVNLTEAPLAVFSGIEGHKKPFLGAWPWTKPVLPGEVIYHRMYDESSQKWTGYALFAEGRVTRQQPGQGTGSISGVDDYALWLQVADLDANHQIIPGTIRQQCLFKGDIGMSEHAPYPMVYQLYFRGDLDGDGKLDLIIGSSSRGNNFRLYLSSQAEPGFLLKIVAEFTDYGC